MVVANLLLAVAAGVVLFGLGGACFALMRRRQPRSPRASDQHDRLARLLVDEFEEHSNGWFWQTDADGQLTYLSAKVAGELDSPDAPAIGQPLNALFRMDSASPETERTIGFHLASRTAFSNYSVRPASNAKLDRWWSISGRPVTVIAAPSPASSAAAAT